MLHLHLNVNLGSADDVREFAKFGDGSNLKLIVPWVAFIAGLFGLKLPPLPDFSSDVKEPVVDAVAKA